MAKLIAEDFTAGTERKIDIILRMERVMKPFTEEEGDVELEEVRRILNVFSAMK